MGIAEERSALRRVATLVAGGTPPDEVFAAVAAEVGQLLTAEFAILLRYDAPRDEVEITSTWANADAPVPTPVGTKLPLGGHNVITLVYRPSTHGPPSPTWRSRSTTACCGSASATTEAAAPPSAPAPAWPASGTARRRSGGHVELASPPGEGTAVRIFLPCAGQADSC